VVAGMEGAVRPWRRPGPVQPRCRPGDGVPAGARLADRGRPGASCRPARGRAVTPGRWGWTWEVWGDNEGYRHNGERVGWTDGENVYLDPEGSYKAACQFAEAARSPLGLSKHALHKLLAERGLLASRADLGHFTAKRDLDGKVGRRVLHLTIRGFESAEL
jgi:hypothetical protein